MTRKQFFKKYGLDQYRDKAPYLAVVKKYKGYLSYFRLSLLIYCAVSLRRYGAESIISYIEAVLDSELREKQNETN